MAGESWGRELLREKGGLGVAATHRQGLGGGRPCQVGKLGKWSVCKKAAAGVTKVQKKQGGNKAGGAQQKANGVPEPRNRKSTAFTTCKTGIASHERCP